MRRREFITLTSGSAAAWTTAGPRAAAGNTGRRRDERPRTGRVQASNGRIPSRRRQMCSDPSLSKQPRIYSITRYRVASSTCEVAQTKVMSLVAPSAACTETRKLVGQHHATSSSHNNALGSGCCRFTDRIVCCNCRGLSKSADHLGGSFSRWRPPGYARAHSDRADEWVARAANRH